MSGEQEAAVRKVVFRDAKSDSCGQGRFEEGETGRKTNQEVGDSDSRMRS